MSYLKKSLSGLSWTAALRGGTRIATIVRIAILARLLTPDQFGAFGIAAMALGLLEILTETGINVVLLQEDDNYLDYVNSSWVVSIIRGILISILIVISAPWVANFFSSPQALDLLYMVAWVPLIRGFINPACIKFLKELRFEREFSYRLVITSSEIVVSIIAALVTHSAESFGWGLIISALVEVFMSFVFISPRPRWTYEWSKITHVLNNGKWITGFGIFDYVFTQGDNATVGKIMGPAALGVYRNAYSFSTLPVTEISQVFYTVMFPVFVNMRGDIKRLRVAVVKSVSVVSVVMVAVGLGVFVFADPLVRILLGNNWLEAIPVIKILAFAGIFRGLSYSFNPIFVAMGKQKYVTAVIFVSMLGLVLSIVPLVQQFGIVGAGYSAVFASAITLPITLILAWKVLKSL